MARKLVKEMEDHKVSRADGVSVRNRFTVFLCPEDYERVRARAETLADKLERHLAKHVRAKKYLLPGGLSVDIVVDIDLKLGHFGILAERDAPGLAEQDAAERVGKRAPVRAREQEPAALFEDFPAPTPRLRAERVRKGRPAKDPAPGGPAVGTTAVIGAEDAEALGLAWQTIVLRTVDRECEFTKGRIIVGRAREADFRIDDSNVSRQHAAIFWADGSVMIEDLDSTNGTMVNGYPVSSTVIRPGDVVVIGDCRITIETR
ncbi:MAG: DUF3662 domain-containing protein [Thermoleophilia bacterium]|nr:DUF3662 domain-containing protein [Thermoleophilia bacterium]